MSEAEIGTALIPAPRDGAECVGGAAPGPRHREAPASGRRSDAREAASRGGGVRWFCDVHRTRRNGEGFRITFTADGSWFGQVDGFEEIPAKAGDRVFVDTIPPQHADGVIGMLRRGVEVYYLRRLTLVARRREELRLSKTTKNDVRALMSIEEKWFRRVSEDFLVMRRMILAYRSLLKTRQQLLNKYKALTGQERNVLRPAIQSIEGQMEALAKEISEEAGKRYPAYSKLVRELGIEGNTAGKEALAELMTYIGFGESPLRGLKKLLGLYKPIRSRKKKHWRLYNGLLRQALSRLAMAHYGAIPNGRQCWMLVKRLRELSAAQTPG